MSKTLDVRRHFGRHRGASVSREIASVVVVAIVLSWVLKTFFIQAFYIPSGSMENTLQVRDRIVVDKLAPGIRDLHRGDIVVFHDPDHWLDETTAEESRSPLSPIYDGLEFLGLVPVRSGDDLVKRVIGVAGDEVECCDAQGRVTVNKVPLDEPYIYPGAKPSDTPFKVVVPPGRLWVMGDHRDSSADSRYHPDQKDHGFVPLDKVVGTASAVVWPFDHLTRLKRPDTFEQEALQPGTAH